MQATSANQTMHTRLTDIGRRRVRRDAVRFEGHSPHQHDRPQLVYIVLGHADLSTDRERLALSEGTGAWLPARLDHALDLVDGGVAMGPMLTVGAEPPLARPQRIDHPEVRRLMTTVLGVRPRTEEEISVFRSALESALSAISTQYFPLPMPAHPATQTIARESVHSARTLEQLASRAFISPRHAQRLFIEETGLAFATWRTRARLNVAISCLRNGGTLPAAMAESGFATREGLVKAVQRECGVPLEAILDGRAAHPQPGSEPDDMPSLAIGR